jgi:hypothetical protein
MENIKEAFAKVKQDTDFLKEEILFLNKDLIEMRKSLIEVIEILRKYKKEEKLEEKTEFTQNEDFPTHSIQNQAHPIYIPTDNMPQNPQNTKNMDISTGNGGVPTDRQTDRQTDQHTQKGSYNSQKPAQEDSIKSAVQILDSLDNLKKEIRLKFKRLTEQEILVFSTLYQLSEGEGHADYKNLSEKLNLTESSIRDYVGRLIKKGIPIEKVKVNNKTIHLSISPNLKRIASLATILQLRSI